MPETRTSFGLVGPFDVDSLDVQLAWRISLNELRRRRPDLCVRSFAPFGSQRPIPIAADEAVEPLLPYTDERRRAIAEELRAMLVIEPPFSLDELGRCYTANPAADPADVAQGAALLRDLSVPGATAHLARAPHPAHIARRWWSYAVCEQRRDFLRAMHWWPHHLPAVVVQGGPDDIGQIDLLVSELPLNSVVVLEAEPGDEAFSETMQSRLGPRAMRLPRSRSSLEDRVAAVAGAAFVVAGAPAVHALAASYARPHQTIAERLAKHPPHEVPAAAPEGDALDRVYDELARLDGGTPQPVIVAAEIMALRTALDELARRTAQERVVLGDYVRAVRNVANEQLHEVEATRHPSMRARVVRKLRPDRG